MLLELNRHFMLFLLGSVPAFLCLRDAGGLYCSRRAVIELNSSCNLQFPLLQRYPKWCLASLLRVFTSTPSFSTHLRLLGVHIGETPIVMFGHHHLEYLPVGLRRARESFGTPVVLQKCHIK